VPVLHLGKQSGRRHSYSPRWGHTNGEEEAWRVDKRQWSSNWRFRR
jgi:hypothetical protein